MYCILHDTPWLAKLEPRIISRGPQRVTLCGNMREVFHLLKHADDVPFSIESPDGNFGTV
jgi:hypothetical protein